MRRLAVPLIALLLLAVTATVGGAAGGRPVHTQHSIGGRGVWTPVSETVRPDGVVEDMWQGDDGSIVSAIGLPGAHVEVLPVSVRHGAGRTVEYSTGLAISGGVRKSASVAADGIALASSLNATQCASYYSSDRHVYMYGCDNQYLDQVYSGGNWYMADEQKTSARSDCEASWSCDHMTSVYSYVSYTGGNSVVQWTPGSTGSWGSCVTVGVSFTSNYSSVTYSESQEICPSSFGPYVLNTTQFGSIWKGRTPRINSFWVGDEAEDEVHNPPAYSPTFTYYQYMNWCSWC